ncbi:MAG TPA: helix-turn-helix transcriptional regulator [Pseudonocardia sp.]|jgi:transcriptional regulator with XRE-family HTH domain
MPDRLSTRLKQLRGQRRQLDVAAASGVSQSAITRFENGRQVPRPDQVTALLQVYGAAQRDVDELAKIASGLRAGQRRIVLQRDQVAVQQEIRNLQHSATLIRSFSPSDIPGLLQTPRYVHAIFGDDPGAALRLEGQSILDDLDCRFVFLIPEGSLGWAMLPAEGMAEQVEHLATVSRRPNVRVGIIPWGRPSEILPTNSSEMCDDRVVWTGTNNGTMLSALTDIESYRALFVELERLAVFNDEARAILARVAERYRSL